MKEPLQIILIATRAFPAQNAFLLHRHPFVPPQDTTCTALVPNTPPGAALATCLQQSDCVMIHRNTPAACLRPPLKDTLPTQCLQLIRGYGECKRGMVDMRKRFRGNKPISTSKELEGDGDQEIGMLYAGKSGYEGVGPKGSDGRSDENEEKYLRNDGVEDIRKK